MPCPSRKNSRFSGKNRLKAREVHLLLVGLDLREVGVVGEVGGQVLRDAVLHVDADVAVEIVRDRRAARRSVVSADDGVRLDLEVRGCRRRLEADQRRRQRDLQDHAAARHRGGIAREERLLVLPADRAARR